MGESDKKKANTVRFAVELSQALQLEEQGTHVVYYMDESFVNTGHTNIYSWYKAKENDIAQQSGKGKRLVLVHAISKHGPLHTEGARIPHVGDLPEGESYETAEWVYEAKSRGDYHTQMNSQRFLKWCS